MNSSIKMNKCQPLRPQWLTFLGSLFQSLLLVSLFFVAFKTNSGTAATTEVKSFDWQEAKDRLTEVFEKMAEIDPRLGQGDHSELAKVGDPAQWFRVLQLARGGETYPSIIGVQFQLVVAEILLVQLEHPQEGMERLERILNTHTINPQDLASVLKLLYFSGLPYSPRLLSLRVRTAQKLESLINTLEESAKDPSAKESHVFFAQRLREDSNREYIYGILAQHHSAMNNHHLAAAYQAQAQRANSPGEQAQNLTCNQYLRRMIHM